LKHTKASKGRKNSRHAKAQRRFDFPAPLTLLLIAVLVLLVPSSGPVANISDMLAQPEQMQPTPQPVLITPQPVLITPQPALPTPEPSDEPTQAPAVQEDEPIEWQQSGPEIAAHEENIPVEEIAPTPEPLLFVPAEGAILQPEGEYFDPKGDGSMIKTLPMDDFSGGTLPLESGYSEDRRVYEDESITVVTYQEKWDGTIYTVAEVTIAHPSQLRTAIAGTPSSPARSKMVKLAGRVNAVVAIDGDYYADRKGAYAVRQSQLLSDSFASDLDLLVIDYNGDFHCILASEKAEAIPALEGQIYQCISFGPVLIRDGEKIEYPADYQFGLDYLNPRAGIGQMGERKYMLVVASGRTQQSLAITAGKLQDFMHAKGCVQAYNVDGGASAELVFDGQSCSPLTPSGERGLYDIIYFATTAGEGAE